MKQFEQVILAMRNNGGYATLGFLNQHVDVSKWATKTPFASIRRIVQDERLFFKIRPGLWALKECRNDILAKFDIEESKKKVDFSHTYFQGLLLEIGNLKGLNTYVTPQDKNKKFLNSKSLGEISSVKQIFEFTFDHIVDRAKTVDVIWFNNRNFPDSFFEVEHSTDIQNSLLKFNELQDFNARFYIVSAVERKREFESKISYSAFNAIQDRVEFRDYEFIARLHTKSCELSSVGTL
jgi:hypothetical protein